MSACTKKSILGMVRIKTSNNVCLGYCLSKNHKSMAYFGELYVSKNNSSSEVSIDKPQVATFKSVVDYIRDI